MEHPFSHCTEETYWRETEYAATSDVLETTDWTAYDLRCGEFQVPAPTNEPWLGRFEPGCGAWQTETHGLEAWLNDSYHQSRGWDPVRPYETGSLRDASPVLQDERLSDEDVTLIFASYIQHWLYIGLLEALLEKRVKASYVVRTDRSGEQYLYTRNLTFALAAWTQKVNGWGAFQDCGWPDNFKRERVRLIREQIFTATSLLLGWIDHTLSWQEHTEPTKFPSLRTKLIAIAPSFLTLARAVDVCVDWPARDDVEIVRHRGSAYESVYAQRTSRLQRRGWCPSFIFRHQIYHANKFLDYVDAAGLCNPAHNHVGCTRSQCIRDNIDPESYRQSHRSVSCKCSKIGPKFADVAQIIVHGKVPVVTLKDDSRLVVKCGVPGQYVSFSHVWAHGLGSTTEQGIYICQAMYLSQCASSIYNGEETAFWIDSICVPSPKDLRRKAIATMKDVYDQAAAVIVLDKAIEAQNQEPPAITLMWNILASAWMHRLWTYQEARLARRLFMQTKDGAVELEDIVGNDFVFGSTWSQMHVQLRDDLVHTLLSICEEAPVSVTNDATVVRRDDSRPVVELEGSESRNTNEKIVNTDDTEAPQDNKHAIANRAQAEQEINQSAEDFVEERVLEQTNDAKNVGDASPVSPIHNTTVFRSPLSKVIDALCMRTTSRSSDEVPAVAGILGVNVSKLLEEDDELPQICRLVLSIGTIPFNIIFLKRKRISFSPFRWLPETMLGFDLTRSFAEVDTNVQTPALSTREGLKVNIRMVKLEKPVTIRRTIKRQVYRVNVDGVLYELAEHFKAELDPSLTLSHFDRILFGSLPHESEAWLSKSIVRNAMVAEATDASSNSMTCDYSASWTIVNKQSQYEEPANVPMLEGWWETIPATLT